MRQIIVFPFSRICKFIVFIVPLVVVSLDFLVSCSSSKVINLGPRDEQAASKAFSDLTDVTANSSEDIKIFTKEYPTNQYYIGEASVLLSELDAGEKNRETVVDEARLSLAKSIYVHINSEFEEMIRETGEGKINQYTRINRQIKTKMDLPGDLIEQKEIKDNNKLRIICAINKNRYRQRIQSDFDTNIDYEKDLNKKFQRLNAVIERLSKYPPGLFDADQKKLYLKYLVEFETIVNNLQLDDNNWRSQSWDNIEEKRYLKIKVKYKDQYLDNISLLIPEYGDTLNTSSDKYTIIDLKKYTYNDKIQFTIIPIFKTLEFHQKKAVLYSVDEDQVTQFRTQIVIDDIDFSGTEIPEYTQIFLNTKLKTIIKDNLHDVNILTSADGKNIDYIFMCRFGQFSNSNDRKKYGITYTLLNQNNNSEEYIFADTDIDAENLESSFSTSIKRWIDRFKYYTIMGKLEVPQTANISIRQGLKEKNYGKQKNIFSCKKVIRRKSAQLIVSMKGYRTRYLDIPVYESDSRILEIPEPIVLEKSHGYFSIKTFEEDNSTKGQKNLIPLDAQYSLYKSVFPFLPLYTKKYLEVAQNTPSFTGEVPPGWYKLVVKRSGFRTVEKRFRIEDKDNMTQLNINLSEKPVLNGIVRNVVIPGWGQLYMDHPKPKALVHFSVTMSSYVVTLWTYYQFINNKQTFQNSQARYNKVIPREVTEYRDLLSKAKYDKKKMLNSYLQFKISISVSTALFIYNMIDLYLFKEKIKSQ